MRYYLTPIRIAIMKKKKENNEHWQGGGKLDIPIDGDGK